MPVVSSLFNYELQPIRLPDDFPTDWSNPIKAQCRSVLPRARRLMRWFGTVENLPYFLLIVLRQLGENDQEIWDFCREFGRNAIVQMADLIARIVRINIDDGSLRYRLLDQFRESPGWKLFVAKAAGVTEDKPVELDYFEVFPWDGDMVASRLPINTGSPPAAPQPTVPSSAPSYGPSQGPPAKERSPEDVTPGVESIDSQGVESVAPQSVAAPPVEAAGTPPGEADLARNSEASQDPPPAATLPEVSQSVESKQTLQSTKRLKPSMKYRTHLRRAIWSAFIQNPEASDREVVAFLDAEDSLKIPDSLKTEADEQTFGQVYRQTETKQKHNLEATISKIRRNMHKS